MTPRSRAIDDTTDSCIDDTTVSCYRRHHSHRAAKLFQPNGGDQFQTRAVDTTFPLTTPVITRLSVRAPHTTCKDQWLFQRRNSTLLMHTNRARNNSTDSYPENHTHTKNDQRKVVGTKRNVFLWPCAVNHESVIILYCFIVCWNTGKVAINSEYRRSFL